MKLHTLKPEVGSTHSRRRIGRGPGSGLGGTSTRGHKGAKARSGYKRKIGFEGGQMPLQRRVPKFGFKNINHKEYLPVNLSSLQLLADKGITKIGIAELKENNLVKGRVLVKILGKTKKYRYAVEKESGEINSEKLLNVFKNCLLSIERAQNLVVLKTISGSGNSAGLIVDKLRLS